MQLEVLSPTGKRILAEASQNHIASIALSDNSGWEELILVDPAKAKNPSMRRSSDSQPSLKNEIQM